MTEPIAEFTDYPSLLAALRHVPENVRSISCETLDSLAGIPSGQASKLLSPCGSRKLTWQTLPHLLAAMALRCQIISDDAALAKINGRMKPRDMKVARDGGVTIVLSRRFLSKIGRKGAAKTNALRKARREAARKAALTRWHGRANGGGQ